MEPITVICTTIGRPRCATEFIASLRAALPDVPAILSQQDKNPGVAEICAARDVQHMPLPFDCGLSKARNAMVRAVTTEYFVLTDDDFRFENVPDFSFAVRFLETHSDFLCITGEY